MKCAKKGLLSLVLCLFATMSFAAPTGNPIGYWKTLDDVSGQPKSIIHIWKTNNVLMGKIVKVFPKNREANRVCTACEGSNRNQPIVGMVILSGLKASENQWGNGRILDPENGRTYKCAVHTTANGQKLNVRGYIGIPILGRSQTWERVDLMSVKTG